MNAREFFYLVSRMRAAQDEYFKTRRAIALIHAKDLEKVCDMEIARVKEIIKQQEEQLKTDGDLTG